METKWRQFREAGGTRVDLGRGVWVMLHDYSLQSCTQRGSQGAFLLAGGVCLGKALGGQLSVRILIGTTT